MSRCSHPTETISSILSARTPISACIYASISQNMVFVYMDAEKPRRKRLSPIANIKKVPCCIIPFRRKNMRGSFSATIHMMDTTSILPLCEPSAIHCETFPSPLASYIHHLRRSAKDMALPFRKMIRSFPTIDSK